MKDCVAKGRSNRGSRNGKTALTEKSVRLIRRLRGRGITPKQLAQRFGVARRTVYHILAEETWKHAELDNVKSS